MYAITGITGQVGGVVASTLLTHGLDVRAVVRDRAKAATWAARGCDTALADLLDTEALIQAFSGTEGVFILLPPNFDPSEGYPESRAVIASIATALRAAVPRRVVCLSTIGAQAREDNLLSQLRHMEIILADLPLPVAFLRAGWFMENARWDIEPAIARGVIPSFLQPLDKPVPMVATADVGRIAANLLLEDWTGVRVVELEGPTPVTPCDIAFALSRLLHKPVYAEAVPRSRWDELFRAQGMKNPLPRMRMLDGFNEGWITFEHPEQTVRGTVAIDDVLHGLLRRANEVDGQGAQS